MTSTLSLENAELLGKGSNSEVYSWGTDQVLKLFFEHDPLHANEVIVTVHACNAGIPAPKVTDGLIEVDDREGIVFERIDGPTMSEYLQKHPEELEDCAKQSAELLAEIHSIKDAGPIPTTDRLIRSIKQAACFDGNTQQRILDALDSLPIGDTLCHGDFHSGNVIMSSRGPIAIDWAVGGRGNPTYDYANTKILLMNAQDVIEKSEAAESAQLIAMFLKAFADVLCQRYQELRTIDRKSLPSWLMMAAAVRAKETHAAPDDPLIALVRAVLNGTEHPWL